MLAKIGTEKRIMLSGIRRDQAEVDFSQRRLEPADGILIASDVRINTSLTSLNLSRNGTLVKPYIHVPPSEVEVIREYESDHAMVMYQGREMTRLPGKTPFSHKLMLIDVSYIHAIVEVMTTNANFTQLNLQRTHTPYLPYPDELVEKERRKGKSIVIIRALFSCTLLILEYKVNSVHRKNLKNDNFTITDDYVLERRTRLD